MTPFKPSVFAILPSIFSSCLPLYGLYTTIFNPSLLSALEHYPILASCLVFSLGLSFCIRTREEGTIYIDLCP